MEKSLTSLVADRVRMRRWVLGSTVFLALFCLVLEVVNVLLATAYWVLLCVCLLFAAKNYTRKDEIADKSKDKGLEESVGSDSITIDNVNSATTATRDKMWYFLSGVVFFMCTVCAIQFVAAFVTAGAVSANYVADHILMAFLSVVLGALGMLLLKLINTAPPGSNERTCSCPCCCSTFLLGLVVFLASVSLWHTCSKADGLLTTNLPPGRLVKTSHGPPMHIWCDDEGKNKSAPTVVFLHGFLGGCLDPTWVRRDPEFLKTGLRFCSLDRPGYGYSPGYDSWDTERHFGRVAKLTQETLHAAKVTDAILLFHSLGGYHALALAKQVEDDPDIHILGGVAIDALAPQWARENKRRPSTHCAVDAPLAPADWFWSGVQKVEPSGLPRLMYATGFNGYDTLVRMLPEDIGPKYLANDMLPRYFQAVVDESRRWAQNCGYAKAGESAMKKFKRLDVIVVPDGVNVPQYSLLNNNSNVVILEGPKGNPHAGVLLDKAWAPKVAKVLIDVINEVH